eukprot:TRINITY_DN65940_c14_g1_i1.p1 TRINITY_DN65940_c14_g1~~TRINITY_DN65940_c14_g1_i1.p1  ORF type:complete len:216 (+),score=25.17 TRINITY_DN65940_c14_g1_i1:21-668(+)
MSVCVNCEKEFDPANNPKWACTYHPGNYGICGAIKRGNGYTCCGRDRTDEGCKTGPHTTEFLERRHSLIDDVNDFLSMANDIALGKTVVRPSTAPPTSPTKATTTTTTSTTTTAKPKSKPKPAKPKPKPSSSASTTTTTSTSKPTTPLTKTKPSTPNKTTTGGKPVLLQNKKLTAVAHVPAAKPKSPSHSTKLAATRNLPIKTPDTTTPTDAPTT